MAELLGDLKDIGATVLVRSALQRRHLAIDRRGCEMRDLYHQAASMTDKANVVGYREELAGVHAEGLGALWCRLMHNSPRWPIHGQYQCAICGRHHLVQWAVPTGSAS